jgi:hypothetical protein
MSTPINFARRRIAINRLAMAMHCMHSAMATPAHVRDAERSASPERKEFTLLGLAAAKLAAGLSAKDVIALLMHRSPDLRFEDAEQYVIKAEPAAESMRSRKATGSVAVRREKLCIWKDPATGWELTAEPDRWEPCRDDFGEYIHITDEKYPRVVRQRHIENVRLFGLVCYMLLLDGGAKNIRIKLSVESMRETHTEWFTARAAEDLLAEVRKTIRELEAANAEPNRIHPRAVGDHCYACPLREMCRQGKKFRAREQEAIEQRRNAREAARERNKVHRHGKSGKGGRRHGRNSNSNRSGAACAA